MRDIPAPSPNIADSTSSNQRSTAKRSQPNATDSCDASKKSTHSWPEESVSAASCCSRRSWKRLATVSESTGPTGCEAAVSFSLWEGFG